MTSETGRARDHSTSADHGTGEGVIQAKVEGLSPPFAEIVMPLNGIRSGRVCAEVIELIVHIF